MNKENCALKLVDEIILYYDARSKNIKKLYFLICSEYGIFRNVLLINRVFVWPLFCSMSWETFVFQIRHNPSRAENT